MGFDQQVGLEEEDTLQGFPAGQRLRVDSPGQGQLPFGVLTDFVVE
jgi:hypothetical protein